ncbi:heme-dependent catalase, partial [Trichodelitschia bisporula]
DTESKVLLRISTVAPERGGAETVRDVKGWGIKIFTSEGNQDFVFNSIPVFFVRDPIKFPSLNRSHKRDPATNAADAAMFWDFHTTHQEGIHTLMVLFTARGTPASLRQIHSYSGHTYKLTRPDGSFHYAKLTFRSKQGIRTLTAAEASTTAGTDPDFHARDMRAAIEGGDFPAWTLCAQAMTPAQAEAAAVNVSDMTHVWPQSEYPLQEQGSLELNRNPGNFFAEIEQAAFSPSIMVPGFAPSADPMLQVRVFAYPDAARYHLGANYQLLPSNRPVVPVYAPYQRDGFARTDGNYGGDPNYVGSALRAVKFAEPSAAGAGVGYEEWVGRVSEFATSVGEGDFVQPRAFWEVLKGTGQDRELVGNLVADLGRVGDGGIRKRAVEMFSRVDGELGGRVREGLRGKQESDQFESLNDIIRGRDR